jgi:hypothetical protein
MNKRLQHLYDGDICKQPEEFLVSEIKALQHPYENCAYNIDGICPNIFFCGQFYKPPVPGAWFNHLGDLVKSMPAGELVLVVKEDTRGFHVTYNPYKKAEEMDRLIEIVLEKFGSNSAVLGNKMKPGSIACIIRTENGFIGAILSREQLNAAKEKVVPTDDDVLLFLHVSSEPHLLAAVQ